MQRKRRLAFKQPEIEKCLNAVQLLVERQEAGEPVSAAAPSGLLARRAAAAALQGGGQALPLALPG